MGTGIIGVFNVSSNIVTELIHLSQFPAVAEANYYIIRAYSSGLVSKPLQITDPRAIIAIMLDIRGYDILSAYPLRGFLPPMLTEEVQGSSADDRISSEIQETTLDDETTWVAVLGLIGKMAAAATVESTMMQMDEKGRIVVDTKLKALGTLGIPPPAWSSLT